MPGLGGIGVGARRKFAILDELVQLLQGQVDAGGGKAPLAQTGSPSGTSVAAGGNIAPAITFTPLRTGRVRLRAFATMQTGDGATTPVLKQNGTVVFSFAQASSAVQLACPADFVVAGLPLNTAVTFAFTTTAGDLSVTLGHGSTGSGSAFSVEEID